MGSSLKFRMLVAFAGGVALAAAAFYVLSKPLHTAYPSKSGAFQSTTPAVLPQAPSGQPPLRQRFPAVPPKKPNLGRPARRFVANSAFLAAPRVMPSAVISLDPPPVAAIETPDLLASLVSPLIGAVEAGSRTLTVPENTIITILLGERLASDRNVAGDAFFGTLAEPLVADGGVIAERGARVLGRVVDVEPAGKTKGVATLVVELSSITLSGGQRLPVHTARFVRKGDTSKKDDAVKIGIGSVIGAAIGAAVGGGKGAAIGAAGGAAAGAGAVALTRGKAAVLEPETRLSFALDRAVTVTEPQ